MSAPVRPFEIDLEKLEQLPEAEREQAAANLGAIRELLKANPLWSFLPHRGEQQYREENGIPLTGSESRGQIEFLECNPKDVFLGAVVAGNRFGKTEINVKDAAIQTLPWEFIPPWLAPYKRLDPAKRDIRIRFIGPDLNQWLAKSMIDKMRATLPPAALKGGSFDKAWRDKERKLTFADGSWWDFLTHDMDLDAFSSVELDRACFDEEPTGASGERQYDETVRGLADREGDVRFTLTPVEGIGWLFSELSDEDGEPRQDGPQVDPGDRVWVVSGDIDHNPHLTEKGKRPLLKRWERSGELDQRKKGLWKHREGLIFPEYQRRLEAGPLSEAPGGHLRSDRSLRAGSDAERAAGGGRFPVEASGHWRVPVFEAIDPGINVDHPFAFVVAFLNTAQTDAHGREDVLEVFHCHKLANGIVAEHAEHIKELRAALGYRPQFTVIDPAAQNRNPETGRKLQEAFRREGIHTVLGQNDRALTYAEIRGRLVDRRLVVWTSADRLLGDEFVNYRWKRASGRTEDVAKPEPIKRNDDLIDALRYMVLRIPVWRGDAAYGPAESEDPRRRLARESLKQLRARGGKRRGKTGGVW
jgi:hypothetical protein